MAGSIRICLIAEGFVDDLLICIESIKKFTNTPITIYANGKSNWLPLEKFQDPQISIIEVKNPLGWGNVINHFLNTFTEDYLVIMDPSTTFTGDPIAPALVEAEKGYAAVGWKGGLVNLDDDWRSIDDKGAGEVDVLFSYFLAVHRLDALEAKGFSNRAIYYRNADIEFSLNLRHAQGRLLQLDLPLEQDRHHGYYDVDPEFRDIQSKKNYDRILERFRGKTAILSPRR